MDDYNTLEHIMNQLENIEKNNWETMDYINTVDLLLTSNNNGNVKDPYLSKRFEALRDHLEEAIQSANEFMTLLKNPET